MEDVLEEVGEGPVQRDAAEGVVEADRGIHEEDEGGQGDGQVGLWLGQRGGASHRLGTYSLPDKEDGWETPIHDRTHQKGGGSFPTGAGGGIACMFLHMALNGLACQLHGAK